jgi:hypothetical protein
MTEIRSYRGLTVWQDAMDLAESLYPSDFAVPKEEMFGLTSQIRRAAVSVAANIAEGHGRERTQAFIQFLRQSQGSLKELDICCWPSGSGISPRTISRRCSINVNR